MTWDALRAELQLWGAEATFWWRDDDAVKDTEALRRLLALRETLDVPLALAVIPERAERFALPPQVDVLQHGWAHRNHAPEGGPKMELGARAPDAVATELRQGWARLGALFPTALRVMVPPWNRIAPEVREILPGLGYRGLSTFKSRHKGPLTEINTHVDIVDWSGTRGFVGEERALANVIGHLAARRTGAADRDEPTGLLTHHLAHDEACWRFIGAFVAFTRGQPAARWCRARDIFAA